MMETIPLVMQFIRQQMRSHCSHDLTVPQLRSLYFINLHDRPSLSDAAEFIGLSLPAMSRLMEALVKKGLVTRTPCPNDRRHVRLGLTAEGKAALDVSWQATHTRLTEEVDGLSPEQCGIICSAMEVLRGAFDPDTVGG